MSAFSFTTRGLLQTFLFIIQQVLKVPNTTKRMSEYTNYDAQDMARIFDQEMRAVGADVIAGLLHVHQGKPLKVRIYCASAKMQLLFSINRV